VRFFSPEHGEEREAMLTGNTTVAELQAAACRLFDWEACEVTEQDQYLGQALTHDASLRRLFALWDSEQVGRRQDKLEALLEGIRVKLEAAPRASNPPR
jgi:hypothetical protein